MKSSDGSECKAPERHPMLRRLQLHDVHIELGAQMAAFAGYEMPMRYASGVLKEHLHTRSLVGLFDVSHMGQILVHPLDGNFETAARGLERLVPVDVLSLRVGRQRYAFFTTENGGISDDLMIARLGDSLLLVVNAARKEDDEALLRGSLSDFCRIEPLEDRVLLALQGPSAAAALGQLAPETSAMKFMDVGIFKIEGDECFISRSGYTGEDGFELSIPKDSAHRIALGLLSEPSVRWVGLGARDSLRLEAGLCLYGCDIDSGTSPVEAGLEWAIQKSRRRGGQRAGGFTGEQAILNELDHGAVRRRVGLSAKDRPIRGGALLFETDQAVIPFGQVSSGGFGPTLRAPVAMGYLPISHSRPGTQLFAVVGDRRVEVTVTELPFVSHGYKR
jgi:aminomethyltransferase